MTTIEQQKNYWKTYIPVTFDQEAIADLKEKDYGKESNKNYVTLAKLSIGTKA